MRTSTAERNGFTCPKCGDDVTQDPQRARLRQAQDQSAPSFREGWEDPRLLTDQRCAIAHNVAGIGCGDIDQLFVTPHAIWVVDSLGWYSLTLKSSLAQPDAHIESKTPAPQSWRQVR